MRSITIVAIAVLLVAVVTATLRSADAPKRVLWGTYTPNNTHYTDLNYWINYLEPALPVYKQSVRILEVGWAPINTIPKTMELVNFTWAHGAVPMITWMPYPFSTWKSPTPNDDIANGVYDKYIEAFLSSLSEWIAGPDGKSGTQDDRRAYIRFAPQPNGNWFPWSPECPPCGNTGQAIKQTPASYKKMWQYVIGKIRNATSSDSVQVVFAVNNADAVNVNYKMEDFFPDASLVDWVSVTGDNWGTTLPGNMWTSAVDVFKTAIPRISKINASAPIMVSSGSTSHPKGMDAKNAWITEYFGNFTAAPNVKMVMYHNADQSADLAAFGGEIGPKEFISPMSAVFYLVYPALRTAARNATVMISPNATNPRLITDAEFLGA